MRTLSEYFIIFRLILLESTHVTKSSKFLILASESLRKRPRNKIRRVRIHLWTTLTRPCSTNLTPALTVSHIRNPAMTIAIRLRQNALTESLFSTSLVFEAVLMTPIA